MKTSDRLANLGLGVILSFFGIVLAICSFIALEFFTRITFGMPELVPFEKPNVESQVVKSEPWLSDLQEDLRKRRELLGRSKPYAPFSLWKERPFAGKVFSVESDGYRRSAAEVSSECISPKTIFFFGGSTMFSAQVPDEFTIPSLVHGVLQRNFPNECFRVKNFGIDAYVMRQEVNLLVQLLKEEQQIDYAVFYDGVNDVFNKVLLGNEHALSDRFGVVLDRKGQVGSLIKRMLLKSALYRHLFSSDPYDIEISKDTFRMRAESLNRELEILRDLVRALEQKYGYSSLFFLQPTIFSTKKDMVGMEKEIFSSYPELLHLAFEYGDMKLSLATERETNFYDIRSVFDDTEEEIFVDFCHVGRVGNMMVANKISNELMKMIRIANTKSLGNAENLGNARS